MRSAADCLPLIPSPSSMKDRRTLRSQNHKFHQKSISLSSDELQHIDFSLGPSEFQTLYELLTAIYNGLVATNSQFSSATREAMRLVDKVAATSTFNMATAVQSSVQHQIATPPSLSSIKTGSTPVPGSNSVCTHVTTMLSIIHFPCFLSHLLPSSRPRFLQLKIFFQFFESIHVLKTSSSYRTVVGNLVAAVTEAQAVRTTADKEIADLIEQYKSYQEQFKQLLLNIPVHERNYERSTLKQSIISPAVENDSKCHHRQTASLPWPLYAAKFDFTALLAEQHLKTQRYLRLSHDLTTIMMPTTLQQRKFSSPVPQRS